MSDGTWCKKNEMNQHRPWLRGLPLNVLHELETAAAGLNFGHGAGRDLVDQLAKDDAVAQHVLVGSGRKLFAQHGLDPCHDLLLLFLAATLSSREMKKNHEPRFHRRSCGQTTCLTRVTYHHVFFILNYFCDATILNAKRGDRRRATRVDAEDVAGFM